MHTFSLIKSIFGGAPLPAEEEKGLFKEVLYMVLARASRSDLDTAHVEIQLVQKILAEHGIESTEQDIRVAASSEIYEEAPLEKTVARAASQLSQEHKELIAETLMEVLEGDGHVGDKEIEFYNMIAGGLGLPLVDPHPEED